MANTLMDQSIQNTIQSQVSESEYMNPVSLLMLMAKTNELIPPWWSRKRDSALRSFVKTSDHLSGAVYNMSAKMTAIPVRVEAKNKSIRSHVELAERMTDVILYGSQFGEGWTTFYSKLVEDLFTQDNGAFAEIIGPGDPSGPLTGMPFSVAHLDSSRCTRTGNAEFPVVYEDISGKLYKLHWTRVMLFSQMPSNDVQMNGVGYSAVSRVINAAQNLIDISIYKQEKLGSRPQRQMIITGGGLDPEDIITAVQLAEQTMNNKGFQRFSKTIVAGNRNIPDPRIDTIDLASVPDGYDERESTILAMSVVAMGFGMDARELFPAMETGATKADAIVQHMKQRGKGPGQTLEVTERQFGTKVLSDKLKLVFDYQDDAQDRQVAEIESVRSQSRQRDIVTLVINTRVAREKMLTNGEITDAQFEALELEDGRLPSGLEVEILFDSDDPDFTKMLGGTTESNFEQKKSEISKIILSSRDEELIVKARQALAAIYHKFEKPLEEEEEMMKQMAIRGGMTGRTNSPSGKPDDSYDQEKYGRKIGADETVIRGDQQRDAEE